MIGTELLDDPRADPAAVRRQLRDIARLNALFGGTRAVVKALEPLFKAGKKEGGRGTSMTWTLLDVGTGLGDIPRAIEAWQGRIDSMMMTGIAIELLAPLAGAHTVRVDLWVEHLDDSTCVYAFLCSSEDGNTAYARGGGDV